MRTDHLRALSHHYMLARLDKLPADHLQSLYTRYVSLMAHLHEAVTVERKTKVLLERHQTYLDKGLSAKAAAYKSLDDFIDLHASFNWQQNEGKKIPAELHSFRQQIRLDYMYRKAVDALVEGITECLLWSHSND